MTTNDPYTTPDNQYWAEPPRGGEWANAIPRPSETNGLAVASLVLGIVWLFWLGSALAIVFGHVALKQIATRNQSNKGPAATGKGLALAGLVLGYVGAGTFALFVVLPLLAAAGA